MGRIKESIEAEAYGLGCDQAMEARVASAIKSRFTLFWCFFIIPCYLHIAGWLLAAIWILARSTVLMGLLRKMGLRMRGKQDIFKHFKVEYITHYEAMTMGIAQGILLWLLIVTKNDYNLIGDSNRFINLTRNNKAVYIVHTTWLILLYFVEWKQAVREYDFQRIKNCQYAGNAPHPSSGWEAQCGQTNIEAAMV